jgi:hypothetical protein
MEGIKLKAACGMHWLTFTTSSELDVVLDALDGRFSSTQGKGGFGHPFSFVHESGASVFHGSKRDDQPLVVNVPGETCEHWSAEMLKAAFTLKGCITRVDVALDLEPADKARRRLVEMHRAWKRGKVQTLMSKTSHTMYQSEGELDGWTAYFGGTSSKCRLRAYDRRGPLRLEWQFRPEKQVGAFLPGHIIDKGPEALWRTLSQSAVFPMPWYRDLLHGDAIEWTKGEKVDSSLRDAIEQLRTQMGPTLWALKLLGALDDLCVEPEKPRGEILRKFSRWSKEAAGEGYNNQELERELTCKSKSRRVVV